MMQNSSLGKWVAWFTALVAVLTLGAPAGYADESALTEIEKARLLDRVEARWHALEQRDFGAAYEFTSPAYRGVFSKTLYEKKFSYMVEWELTGVELLTYDADAAVASVAARVMSEPVKPTSAASAALGATPRKQVEKWVFVDGQWWFSV